VIGVLRSVLCSRFDPITPLLFGMVGRFTDIYTSWSGRPFFRDEVIRLIVTWLTTFLFLIFVIFAAKTSGRRR
jgi:putative colanic acid biosynthesis UDP-glucose lipid carrier transferase